MNRYYKRYIPKFLKKAARVLTVSNFTKADLIEHYEITADKIKVIYNGCRKVFRPLDNIEKEKTKKRFTDGSDYFFFVGSIHPRKNLIKVIQAFEFYKSVRKSDDKLVISGRFVWKSNATKKVLEQSRVRSDIVLTHHVAEDELMSLVGSAKAVVYPSLYEGFGFPIVEALTAQIPIITSNVSSMPEIGGVFAIYVDPYSVQSIASGMQKIDANEMIALHDNPELTSHLKQFDWDEAAKSTYDELLKTQSK